MKFSQNYGEEEFLPEFRNKNESSIIYAPEIEERDKTMEPTGTGKTRIADDDERTAQLKEKPRNEFFQAIRDDDRVRCLVKTGEIHGHYCPGSALGVMAALYGLRQLGKEAVLADGINENLMAITEINSCFVDGIQAVSGCTLGNNALVYRDLGRTAVTFAIRGKETGIRIRARPEFRTTIDRAVPEFSPLMEKVIMKRAGSAEDRAAFREMARKAAFTLIEMPYEDLLIAETVRPNLPERAPITESVVCPGCGEVVMATKVVSEGEGRGLCFMCAGSYREVEGQGIVERIQK
jgi:formylmethanofuran dehydrogenase subunit E